jgi:hypothetical protein
MQAMGAAQGASRLEPTQIGWASSTQLRQISAADTDGSFGAIPEAALSEKSFR